ncbi:MAG: carboxypeptidase regulatory-like domain-containing protein [Thermodesulfobacteriota bacterium]
MSSSRRLLTLLCAALLVMATLAPVASAHKVNIFAYAEGDKVFTEAYFPDGRPVSDGTIEVLDGSGNILLEGKPDAEGKFSFAAPPPQDLTIVINASMGHKNSFVLRKEEMGK